MRFVIELALLYALTPARRENEVEWVKSFRTASKAERKLHSAQHVASGRVQCFVWIAKCAEWVVNAPDIRKIMKLSCMLRRTRTRTALRWHSIACCDGKYFWMRSQAMDTAEAQLHWITYHMCCIYWPHDFCQRLCLTIAGAVAYVVASVLILIEQKRQSPNIENERSVGGVILYSLDARMNERQHCYQSELFKFSRARAR